MSERTSGQNRSADTDPIEPPELEANRAVTQPDDPDPSASRTEADQASPQRDQRLRHLSGIALCTAIGWLVGGSLGALAGFSVGVLAAVAPETIGAYLALTVSATALATVFEADLGNARPATFVADRPMAADLGALSGIVLLCWMTVQILYRERLASVRQRQLVEEDAAERRRSASALSKVAHDLRQMFRPPAQAADAEGQLVPTATSSEGDRHLLAGSSWVNLGFVLQALTGLGFWAIAANRFEQGTVGLSSQMFTSLQVINYATTLGLPELIARYGRGPRRDLLLRFSVGASFAASVFVSAIFVWGFDSEANRLLSDTDKFVIFALVVASSSLAGLADARLMVDRRWSWVFWRLTLAGLTRIPLVFLPVSGPIGVFSCLAGPIAASAIVSLALIHRHRRATPVTAKSAEVRPAESQPQNAVLARFAGVSWIAHLASNAPQFVLPVIVVPFVTAEQYASFFQAWAIAAFAFILPVTAGKVLLSESSQPFQGSTPNAADPEAEADLERNTRYALYLSGAAMAAATLVSFLVAAFIPLVYGSGYAEAGRLLPWLVAGGLPWAFTSIALANARARGDHLATVLMTAVTAATILGAARVLVPRSGLDGAVTAWALGNVVSSIFAALLIRRGISLAGPEDDEFSGSPPEDEPADAVVAALLDADETLS